MINRKYSWDGVNGILRNVTIAVPLKYLSNFWRSLEMSLIRCKVELKLKRTNHCILSANGNDNSDADANNIIFTIDDTKLYVPVAILSAKDNQNLSKLLSKGFGRWMYWNEYKRKIENKNMANEYFYFLESNYVGINRLFVLIYSNYDGNAQSYKVPSYYLPKCII